VFVAVAGGGTNRVMTSPDGVTWTARAAAEANSWFSVAYGNGVFVAVAEGGANRACFTPTTSAVPATPAPPANLAFPYGLIGFTINGLNASDATTVTVTLPAPVAQYWKLQNGAWHQLTDATFAGNQVSFTLVDGGPDDADATANGTIVDPGAPAVAQLVARFAG
jgi:hypothetical protein